MVLLVIRYSVVVHIVINCVWNTVTIRVLEEVTAAFASSVQIVAVRNAVVIVVVIQTVWNAILPISRRVGQASTFELRKG
ncbi:unnamed protein product [Protopolystoma xenopodis]|uniref:Uncharacterized protein n=1 Tax=Protopolystoma xenopodis TaxID=117903 RepID=A0A448X0B1_9PLAT|nr:unnamed protein product [Protopolystoma xenopodis]